VSKFKKTYPEEMLDLACVVEKIGVLNVDALCFIFTTSLTLEHVAGLMSSLDVNIFEKIMEKKKKYLSLCEEFFDRRGNMNYLGT